MDEISVGARDAVNARYLVVATVSFQIYDYIINLDDEIRLVWTTKVDMRHLHFFLNRYVPFATSFLSLYFVVLSNNMKTCSPGFGSLVFMTVIGMLIAEFTVFLRADAVWGHKRVIRILLMSFYLCSTSVILYVASKHVKANSVLPFHFLSGCLYFHRDRKIWVGLLAYSICEFFALILLLAKVAIGPRYPSSPVMRNLYQDGIVYFSIITVSSIANLVLLVTASPTLSDAFLVPESVLVNILCSHMHLRIRESHLESLCQLDDTLGIELRAPVFASINSSRS